MPAYLIRIYRLRKKIRSCNVNISVKTSSTWGGLRQNVHYGFVKSAPHFENSSKKLFPTTVEITASTPFHQRLFKRNILHFRENINNTFCKIILSGRGCPNIGYVF